MIGSEFKLNSPQQIAIAITNAPIGTGYLGFRDLPSILEKHVKGTDVLDVGCGSGRSTIFLRDLGYKVVGIDTAASMIQQAKEKDKDGDYRLINESEEIWPIFGEKFDLIIFSFVLLEQSSKEKIQELLGKAKNALKESGVIVISTTTEEAYKNDWLSMGTEFSENIKPASGDIVKIYLKDYDFEVRDYYWTDSDYRECLSSAGLDLLWHYKPLGTKDDGKKWVTEEEKAPFSIYVAEPDKVRPT